MNYDYLTRPVSEITSLHELHARRDHDIASLGAESRKWFAAKSQLEIENDTLRKRVKTLEAALLVYAERENWTAINNGDDETDDDERWFVKEDVKHGWQIAAAAISASDQQT